MNRSMPGEARKYRDIRNIPIAKKGIPRDRIVLLIKMARSSLSFANLAIAMAKERIIYPGAVRTSRRLSFARVKIQSDDAGSTSSVPARADGVRNRKRIAQIFRISSKIQRARPEFAG